METTAFINKYDLSLCSDDRQVYSFVIARLSLWSSYKKFVLLSSAADFDLCCRKGTLLLSLKNQGQNIVCWGNRFHKEYGSTNMCKESFKPSKTV